MKKQTIRSLSAAVAMSLIVGASLVACGGKSASTSAAASVTKTGTGKGFGGDIVATLTVEADGTVSTASWRAQVRPNPSAALLWKSWQSRS